MAEDASDDDPVLTMASTGDGADANGWSITDGNTGTAFAIDSTSGAITVADENQIDRETLSSYTWRFQFPMVLVMLSLKMS